MTESSKVQLPIISKRLQDDEIRLHLLVLARSTYSSPKDMLAAAKTWYKWIKEAPKKESW